jgi:hypothetical protein
VWIVWLVVLSVVGWLIFRAGRRQGVRNAMALATLEKQAAAQMATLAQQAQQVAESVSSAMAEVVWQEAVSTIRIAHGGPGPYERERVASLTDDELIDALETSLERLGDDLAKMPPDFPDLVFAKARSIRDGAIADAPST